MTLKDLLDAVSNSPVGPVHVTGNDEENGNRQMVMGDVSHPEAAGNRIQASFEGQKIAVGRPVSSEES